ncbi:hypothetical protein [Rhodococcoides fascians]|uniref:hypothetical protein n=1 Tax=Rhodococcoides fascians TaxID=1828 RepID=UPI0009B7E885|nr:hypothetical protein [Rhodococcus fascians]
MTRHLTPEHRENISEGLRAFYAGLGHADEPRSRRGAATPSTHAGLSGFRQHELPATKPIESRFRGHTTKYRGTDIDSVTPKTAKKVYGGIKRWLDAENSEWSGQSKISGGATINDFDLAAVETAVIQSGLNVDFFSRGLDGGNYEITDDEWADMGSDLWKILDANRRVQTRPPADNFVTGPPIVKGNLSNRDLVQTMADMEELRDTLGYESLGDDESDGYLLNDALRAGLNIRGGLPGSGLDEDVRSDIHAAFDRIYQNAAT